MNKDKPNVKFNLTLIMVITVGVVALASFFFFYSKQKEISREQKRFIFALDTLSNEAIEFRYVILQNYIYAYNNNDAVMHELQELDDLVDMSIGNDILGKPKYISLQATLKKLKNEIDQLFSQTQYYLLYNAAVKNSLLFLAGLETRFSAEDLKQNTALFLKTAKATHTLLYAKRLSDIGYLKKKNFLLQNDKRYSKKLQHFIKMYNLHVAFVLDKLPKLLSIKNRIEKNKIEEIVKKMRADFSKIYIEDNKILNIFSAIFSLIFLFTFVHLIVMLIRYKQEHTRLVNTTKTLHHSLTHDILTGLSNRLAFESDKKTLRNAAVLLINIDRFKDINDTFGNEIGDKLLQAVAKTIRHIASKQKGYVQTYRVGGDEFVVLYEAIGEEALVKYADYLEEHIDSLEFFNFQREVEISASIAVNSHPPLLENADLALKSIKRKRQKKIIVFDEELGLQRQAQNNVATIYRIKKAIKEDRITPYFQPIVNIKTKKVEKFEALVRIVEDDEAIAPFRFLDVAKRTHYYHDITRIIVEKTFQTASLYPDYRFSINFSISDIVDEKLTEEVFALFQKHILIANRIDIELLESEELYDMQKVKRFIERVHSYGSLVLIDDFGSGYSNFAYFAELEIDVLKVDGSIIKEIAVDKRKRHMLESIVMFAKNMHLKIVAEFVESEEIVDILRELGVDYAQGYYFSPPKPTPPTDFNF